MKIPAITIATQSRHLGRAALFIVSAALAASAMADAKGDQISRGQYLVTTSGCNDCHTPGYIVGEGKVDEKLWLTGDTLGWSGPWGTTYPPNLRLLLAGMTVKEWLTRVRTIKPRPPMPWFNLRAMTDSDLKAIYAFTRSLGPGGGSSACLCPARSEGDRTGGAVSTVARRRHRGPGQPFPPFLSGGAAPFSRPPGCTCRGKHRSRDTA
jgi:mono/diheme cytochrome c family protein